VELLELLEWLGRQKLRFSMILQLEPIFLAFRWIVYHPGLLSIAIRLACRKEREKEGTTAFKTQDSSWD